GHSACSAAEGGEVAEGNVGAGTGATVAKLNGIEGALKGGLGTVSASDGDMVVGALAAVNALGEIVDEDGSTIAGSRTSAASTDTPFGNTTLVVVATNARL